MLRLEWERLVNRCVYSWAGVIDTWQGEPSFKFWVAVNLVSAPLSFWAEISEGERALILVLGVLILAAECMNTAVEHAIDLVMPEYHDLAKRAKDAASAGVALTAVAGGVAWVVALI
jgi:diacylglycerol kinase (ATP)